MNAYLARLHTCLFNLGVGVDVNFVCGDLVETAHRFNADEFKLADFNCFNMCLADKTITEY